MLPSLDRLSGTDSHAGRGESDQQASQTSASEFWPRRFLFVAASVYLLVVHLKSSAPVPKRALRACSAHRARRPRGGAGSAAPPPLSPAPLLSGATPLCCASAEAARSGVLLGASAWQSAGLLADSGLLLWAAIQGGGTLEVARP